MVISCSTYFLARDVKSGCKILTINILIALTIIVAVGIVIIAITSAVVVIL